MLYVIGYLLPLRDKYVSSPGRARKVTSERSVGDSGRSIDVTFSPCEEQFPLDLSNGLQMKVQPKLGPAKF
jgi:hypothetical protein